MPLMAALQMCSSESVDDNLKIAEKLITEASNHKAQLIVLPEMFAIMGRQVHDKISVKESFGHGKIQSFLSDMSKKLGVWIAGGTIPIAFGEKKIKAACLVYDDSGTCVARYDKIHLFDVTLNNFETYNESETVEAGDAIVTVDTPLGRLGLAVCYDVRFPDIFQKLALKDIDIIALPSAFTVPTGKAHWEVLTRSRALDTLSYVIAAAQGGTHSNGRKTWGHSMIINPWGEVVAKMDGESSGVIYAECNLSKIQEVRASIPIKKHTRISSQ